MTQTEQSRLPADRAPGEESPCAANAYAITFRLLGARPEARATASAVAANYEAVAADDPSVWLPDLATDAVTACILAVASLHPSPSDGDGADAAVVEQRRALLRRLATLDARSRAAAALVHLAGHDPGKVAAMMGTDPATVEELAAPLAPPPGSSWRELGDPLERGVAPVVRRRRRAHHRRWRAVLAAAVVIALVLWAARLSGPRPVLGPPDAGPTQARFGADVEAVPSSGCAGPREASSEAAVTAETLDTTAGGVAFRLRAPAGDGPAPLLVVLPDYGQTAERFAADTALEDAAGDAVVATLEPPAPALEWNAAADPAAGDDRAALLAVTEELITSRCIDLSRIHLVGFGPGAQLAGATACTASELFASVVMVGGAQMPDRCALTPPVAALFTANADDPVIRPSGGYGPEAATRPGTGTVQRPEVEPLTDVAKRWAGAVGAGTETTSAKADDTFITTRTGPGGVEVTTLLHPAGGHVWGLGDTVALADFVDRTARSI